MKVSLWIESSRTNAVKPPTALAVLTEAGKNHDIGLQKNRKFSRAGHVMASEPPIEDVTALLDAASNGDDSAAGRLFPIVYEELHRLASAYMRNERPDHTLQPTALVNEAYLRLIKPDSAGLGFENRRHFVATAAVAMRRILINHAKARGAVKRGGGQAALALDDVAAAFADRALDLVALDEALGRLAQLDAQQARLVELHFFGGMSFDECAAHLGLSARTVFNEWAHARAWLHSQLTSG